MLNNVMFAPNFGFVSSVIIIGRLKMINEIHCATKEKAIEKIVGLLKSALRQGKDFRVFSHPKDPKVMFPKQSHFRVQLGDYWIDDEWHEVEEHEIYYEEAKG